MMYDVQRKTATPGARSKCPACSGALVAKCGHLVSWHWAHVASDCDPWSEPESEWHIGWKEHFEALGAATEVVMPPHRADVVQPSGRIVELQSSYLGADDIARREQFYGDALTWLYRCTWEDRLHFGRRGFWWKHGSKSMATHRRPVWWHVGDELWRVAVSTVEQREHVGERNGRPVFVVTGSRVLGRVLKKQEAPATAPRALAS